MIGAPDNPEPLFLMVKMSQREARTLKKRVAELEGILDKQRAAWAHEWPEGVHLDTVSVNSSEWAIIRTARKLGHAVVVIPSASDNPNKLHVYGIPLKK